MKIKIAILICLLLFSTSLAFSDDFRKMLSKNKNTNVSIYLKSVDKLIEGKLVKILDDCIMIEGKGGLYFILIDEIAGFLITN